MRHFLEFNESLLSRGMALGYLGGTVLIFGIAD